MARALRRQLVQSRVAIAPGAVSWLLVVVRLSSARVRQAARQDFSFAKKQALPRLVVVQGKRDARRGVAIA